MKIDLYIIRKFLSTFFFILTMIMTIAVIFDVTEKLEDFLKNDPPIYNIVFDYYLNFVLHYGNLFSSLLIFISVIFFTSKMAARTEIVAILSSGVSFKRLLVPYMMCATLLAAISFYLNHEVIPKANQQRIDFENTFIRNPRRGDAKNIHKQISPGEFVYFYRYSGTRMTGQKFAWETWKDGKMTSKLMADIIRWDTTNQSWIIENYVKREIDGMKETITRGIRMDTVININPDDFKMRISNTETMNTDELDAFIAEEQMKGSDNIPYYLIERHQRTSWPFSTYVLVLIGAVISSRK